MADTTQPSLATTVADDATETSSRLAIPRKVPVNGRVWKSVQTKRSSAKRNVSVRPGWEIQQAERRRKSLMKAAENEMKEQVKKEKESKRLQEEERRKRRLENEKMSEVVQKVSASKVKRMKKKQIRALEKR
ncbi:uncharacterized protein BJ171DRAFT_488249 [Polychytrium aggregatum]|uniref:uncharacterized protein n=1 Tax=Polychytrium aggregatum TaxID=110093 RepID=UPI0022FE2198|nr:uncharacterized protein BJ171DRAFT_488249 [Polychytrium aggregatum]KAI9209025.1 hypothetical protein BJ171DRAFT_488249 [Polychytrium aggregatum]